MATFLPLLNAAIFAVALGWSGVTANVANDFKSSFAGGCSYLQSNTAPRMNDNLDSNVQCSNGATCICWIGALCSNTEGASVNPTDCMCGTKICDTDEGRYCRASTNQCFAACPSNNGISINAKACACGSNICDATKGLYCLGSSNQCNTLPLCTNVDGTGANANDCLCGTAKCSASMYGLYCNSAENKCGDVKCLEGTTFGATSSRDLDTYVCEWTTVGTQ